MTIALMAYIADSALYPSKNQPPADITGVDGWKAAFGAYPTAVLDYTNWPAPGHYGAYPNPYYAADNYTDMGAFARVPRARGSVLFVKWQPCGPAALGYSSYDATTWSPFTLTTITAGSMDTWITGWAQNVVTLGQPMLLSFGHEMNGNWYPWGCASGNGQGNTAAAFAAAWRHVWTIFQTVGANRFVKWCWCPNTGAGSYPILTAAYPGDAYVDWIGWDGYNSPGLATFTQFRDLFSTDYTTLTGLSSTKPLMIAETGCRSRSTNAGDAVGAKADWFAQMFETGGYSGTGLSLFPRVQALLYYDQNQGAGGDWRINSDTSSQAAWVTATQDARYQGVLTGDLSSVVARSALFPGSPSFPGSPTLPVSPTVPSLPGNTTSATILYALP